MRTELKTLFKKIGIWAINCPGPKSCRYDRCWDAGGKVCQCACKGKYHGTKGYDIAKHTLEQRKRRSEIVQAWKEYRKEQT